MKTQPPKAAVNLAERYAATHPDFRADLEAISAEGGLPALEIYALWREYSEQCHDQSALVWEFRRWYAEKLRIPKR